MVSGVSRTLQRSINERAENLERKQRPSHASGPTSKKNNPKKDVRNGDMEEQEFGLSWKHCPLGG
jgi:hypothetical protein